MRRVDRQQTDTTGCVGALERKVLVSIATNILGDKLMLDLTTYITKQDKDTYILFN